MAWGPRLLPAPWMATHVRDWPLNPSSLFSKVASKRWGFFCDVPSGSTSGQLCTLESGHADLGALLILAIAVGVWSLKSVCAVPAALLDDLSGNAMVTEGNMEDCPSPLRAVQIGGEDLTMFDGNAVATDGSEFLVEPDLGA